MKNKPKKANTKVTIIHVKDLNDLFKHRSCCEKAIQVTYSSSETSFAVTTNTADMTSNPQNICLPSTLARNVIFQNFCRKSRFLNNFLDFNYYIFVFSYSC